jgi:hypothetical protein
LVGGIGAVHGLRHPWFGCGESQGFTTAGDPHILLGVVWLVVSGPSMAPATLGPAAVEAPGESFVGVDYASWENTHASKPEAQAEGNRRF